MTLEPEVLQLPPFEAAPLPRDPSSGRLYVVTDDHGTRGGRHEGIDLATRDASGRPTTGVPLFAMWPSVVVDVDQDERAGLYVSTEHPDGHQLVYMHLSRADVVPGDIVDAGQLLGLSGDSGETRGPHLHLELRLFGQRPGIDPEPYLEELARVFGYEGAPSTAAPLVVAGAGAALSFLGWLLTRRRR